jgi:hypothetical protein
MRHVLSFSRSSVTKEKNEQDENQKRRKNPQCARMAFLKHRIHPPRNVLFTKKTSDSQAISTNR